MKSESKRFSLRKLPVASLGMLVMAHGLFGWTIAHRDIPLSFWGLIIVLLMVVVLVLTAPLRFVRIMIMRLFKSEIISFLSIFAAAFSVVFLFAWANTTIEVMVLFASMALARLDLQTACFGDLQISLILITFSLLGLIGGGILHYV